MRKNKQSLWKVVKRSRKIVPDHEEMTFKSKFDVYKFIEIQMDEAISCCISAASSSVWFAN